MPRGSSDDRGLETEDNNKPIEPSTTLSRCVSTVPGMAGDADTGSVQHGKDASKQITDSGNPNSLYGHNS